MRSIIKLQDIKKLLKEWKMKVKAFKKWHDDIQMDLKKYMDQIQKDAVDAKKLQSTLSDAALNDACDIKRAMEMVVLLEAQLKDMNPNLDSISEYVLVGFLKYAFVQIV